MNILIDVLKASENVLKEKGIESPRLNAELLLAHTLKTKRINLYLDFEKILSETELNDYREKVRRRLRREPLQYILGETEFYGNPIKVNKNVLIPRQETEILVDKAIEIINKKNLKNVLELGTGSGCIAISISKYCDCNITATDISKEALGTAAENAKYNNSNLIFKELNILQFNDTFDDYELVICNPPYIPKNEMQTLEPEVINYEPVSALTDELDGLTFYKKIIDIAGISGKGIKYLLEIGDNKKDLISLILTEKNITNYQFHKDLMNLDRVLEFERC